MDMVLQGDKNGVFSDVCGYDGKRVSDRRRWKCGIPQGDRNAGFGAKVTVVAEDICDELRKLTIDDIASEDKTGSYTANKENNQTDSDAADRITIIKRKFNQKDCDGMEMVIAATDDNALNHEIAEYCKANGIMVNAVDQKADCSFIFPSYIKEKNLVAAFSSGGNSPVLTQYLKGKEQEILTPFLGELNEYMGQIREK